MLISASVSNTCLFAPAPYYKLDKGFFLGFLFKQEILGKVSFIYYLNFKSCDLTVCWRFERHCLLN